MKELFLIEKHFSVCIEQKRENERDIKSKGREVKRERGIHTIWSGKL
jgi:hypothetical protein